MDTDARLQVTVFPSEYLMHVLISIHRAERKKDQVCSPGEYEKVFARLRTIPPGVEHLIVQLGESSGMVLHVVDLIQVLQQEFRLRILEWYSSSPLWNPSSTHWLPLAATERWG